MFTKVGRCHIGFKISSEVKKQSESRLISSESSNIETGLMN